MFVAIITAMCIGIFDFYCSTKSNNIRMFEIKNKLIKSIISINVFMIDIFSNVILLSFESSKMMSCNAIIYSQCKMFKIASSVSYQ